MNNTTQCVNGTLKVGDLVLSTPEDDYSCLIGVVTQINLLGTPEHEAETENETDDVHVNFDSNYSDLRTREIEECFSELYQEEKRFEDISLDDVIMAPDCLIRIAGLDEKRLQSLLSREANASAYCYLELRRIMQTGKDETNGDF